MYLCIYLSRYIYVTRQTFTRTRCTHAHACTRLAGHTAYVSVHAYARFASHTAKQRFASRADIFTLEAATALYVSLICRHTPSLSCVLCVCVCVCARTRTRHCHLGCSPRKASMRSHLEVKKDPIGVVDEGPHRGKLFLFYCPVGPG